jgi:hypothetical protein
MVQKMYTYTCKCKNDTSFNFPEMGKGRQRGAVEEVNSSII